MTNTLCDRYCERRAEVIDHRRTIEKMKKENVQLRKNLEEITKERDELLGRMNSRGVDVEKKDASVSTETAIPDVEMTEIRLSPRPSRISHKDW